MWKLAHWVDKVIFAIAAILFASTSVQSQVPAGRSLDALGQSSPPAPNAGGPIARAVSPEIHADHSVTIRLSAPNARDVRIAGHIIGPNAHFLSKEKTLAMTKDEKGIWSITLGPLAPEIYDYGFVVDGVQIYNPATPSLVEIPGQTSAYYDARPVPHGEVRMLVYQSKAIGGVMRNMLVYTPAGYDGGKTRYPVLYLMHGGNCCESQWVQNARANTILDNLIADGKARPMIVVMPLGSRAGPSEGLGPIPSQMANANPGPGNGAAQSNYTPGNLFEIDLLTGIIPFIDQRYRTIADADHRALSGLSQGGIQSLTIGLRHTDVFHWVAPMSAGSENQGDDQLSKVLEDVYQHPEPLKKNLKLIYFVAGREDVLHEANWRVADRLRQVGVSVGFEDVPGMHEFRVWRRGLYDLAPLLFVPGKPPSGDIHVTDAVSDRGK